MAKKIFTPPRKLFLVGIQFAGFDLETLCQRISGTFDGLTLGAGTPQFPHREIVKNPKVWDDIKEILARNGLETEDLRIACHPTMMGACAENMHPGYAPFLGDIYAEKSDGTPDEPEIRIRSKAEWEEQLCPAFEIAGLKIVQTFFGSRTAVFRTSREFPRPDAEWLDEKEAREVEEVRGFCNTAQQHGIERVCVESHIGESHLDCYSQRAYLEKVDHRVYHILHDGSHVEKLNGDSAFGVDYLTEHCPGKIGDWHIKGGGVYQHGGSILYSYYPCGDHRRTGNYEAAHTCLPRLIREAAAINRHEILEVKEGDTTFPNGHVLSVASLEHEYDRMQPYDEKSQDVQLNAVMVSGQACRDNLLFRAGAHHQEAMAKGR